MKQTMKKTLGVLLALLMIASLFAGLNISASAALPSSGRIGNASYEFTSSTGELVITGTATSDYGHTESPFYRNTGIKSVVVSAGVRQIGSFLFEDCTNLTSVTLPDSLTDLGSYAFSECRKLSSIDLPDGLTCIDSSTFQYCKALTGVELPSGVRSIFADAFASGGLTSVTIPKNVTYIGPNAFSGCSDLQTVNYTGSPADWSKIEFGKSEADSFDGCPATRTVNFYYGVEGAENAINDIGENDGSDAYLARIAVASAVFMHLTDAEKDMVTNRNVLFAAFHTVRDYDFDVSCGDLVGSAINWSTKEVIISGFGPMEDYDNGNNKSSFNGSKNVKTVVIANGVTSVGEYAFYSCGSLESVTFPDDGSFTAIGAYAFYDCRALTSVTIPKSVTTIPHFTFAFLRSLQTLNYTGSPADWAAMTIQQYAFDHTPLSAPTCYYYGVEGAMNAIDDIGTVTYDDDCKGRIDEARKAYDRLSDYESTLVTNHETLINAENTYKALEVEALIAAIGDVGYTDESKAKIDAARAAYDDLTADQQALVTNVAALTAAETAYAKAAAKEALAAYKNADDYRADEQALLAEAIAAGEAAIDAATDSEAVAAALAAAEAVLDEIKTDAELTAEETLAAAKTAAKEELAAYKNADDYRADEQAAIAEAIAAGEAAIDAATDSEAVVAALAAAEAVLDEIKTDAELTAEELAADIAAADAVQSKIDAIGKVKYDKASKKKIDAARSAWDALTAEQKALVENYETLVTAEKTFAKLKAAAGNEAPKPHGENCVCYDIEGDGTFASIMRFICAFMCFVLAMREALGQ